MQRATLSPTSGCHFDVEEVDEEEYSCEKEPRFYMESDETPEGIDNTYIIYNTSRPIGSGHSLWNVVPGYGYGRADGTTESLHHTLRYCIEAYGGYISEHKIEGSIGRFLEGFQELPLLSLYAYKFTLR